MTIKEAIKLYSIKLDCLDIELIISHVLNRPREFVLSHPEYKLTSYKLKAISSKLARRIKDEPLAYILGHKEFYGLDFKVNKNVLIPRPETEMLVDLAINYLQPTTYNQRQKTAIIDVGTGSGNIIISTAYNMKHVACNKISFCGIDISEKALKVAKENAKLHKVSKKIKFLKGNLLEPFVKNWSIVNSQWSMVIIANLPYVSKKIYSSSPTIKHEPKSSLLSTNQGMTHYKNLLKQVRKLSRITGYELQVKGLFEFSPEQKIKLKKLINLYLPEAKINFFKDLAGKWRGCEIIINNRRV